MRNSDSYADLGGGTTPDPDTPDTPTCICDGTGDAGIVRINGRDVLKVCVACKPHLSRVPTVAQRHVRALPRRRRLTLVR